MDYGKLPPQAIDIEEAVLGAALLDHTCLEDVGTVIGADDFYKEAHRIIFKAITDLNDFNQSVDVLTVVNQLKTEGNLEAVGGSYFVSQLTNRVASSAHVESHARIIKQQSIRRQIIQSSMEAMRSAYDETEDVFNILSRVDGTFAAINNQTSAGKVSSMAKVYDQLASDWDVRATLNTDITGVPSGFTDLDLMTGGFSPGDMIVIAARPGMGKTTTALAVAKNTAKTYKRKIGIITLEMSEKELGAKIMSSETRIDYRRILKQTPTSYEREQIEKGHAEIIRAMGIYFVDKAGMNDQEFKIECRKLVRQHGVDMIIVDYLQLMSVAEKRGKREEEISTISREIKSTAKALGIPIIAMSQLNRSVEQRGGDKRPMLSDLRESGAIEQDADMVIFVYRPEYYGINHDAEGNSTHGLLELLIEKHRGGNTGDIQLHCDLRYSVVENRSNESNQSPILPYKDDDELAY